MNGCLHVFGTAAFRTRHAVGFPSRLQQEVIPLDHNSTHFGARSRGPHPRYTQLRTSLHRDARGFAPDLVPPFSQVGLIPISSALTDWVTLTNFMDPSSCLHSQGLGVTAVCRRPVSDRDCRRAVLFALQWLPRGEGVPPRALGGGSGGRGGRARAGAVKGAGTSPEAVGGGDPARRAARLWVVSDPVELCDGRAGATGPRRACGVGGNRTPLVA